MSANTTAIHNEINYDEYHVWVEQRRESRVPGLVLGNPGIGKTQIPRQVASRYKIGMMELLAYLFEPIDIRGLMVPDLEDRTTFSYGMSKWPFARFVEDGRIPPEGILLLDEALNAMPEMRTALAEPLLDHTVNGEPLAPGWAIICTGNHLGSGTSAGALPSHVINRLNTVVLKPCWNAWSSWAAGIIRPELIGYFEKGNGAELFDFKPGQPNQPYLTPRSLESLSKEVNAWERRRPGQKPPLWLYASCIGDAGAKLYGTIDFIHELASYKEIINAPTQAKIPTTGGAIFAQMSIIIGGLKSLSPDGTVPTVTVAKQALANTQTYIERLSIEVGVAIHQRACHALSTWWKDTDEYVAFFTKNKSVFV